MKRFPRWVIGFSLVLWLSATSAVCPQTASSQSRYPNELMHFKFYSKYLNPLVPYISERDAVIRVLGDSTGVEWDSWRVQPLFVGEGNTVNGRPWAKDITGRLASITIRPMKRVSMSKVKFPREFTHSFGGVSEINVSCDVYRDDSGLEYWIFAEDSASGKKGDLMTIEYGPSKRLKQEIEGSSW